VVNEVKMSVIGSSVLDKSCGKKEPVYYQMANYIKNEIESKVLKPGEHLPPTYQFVKSWKVGYSTVNSALKVLEEEGLISRDTKWGKGPVVLKKNEVVEKHAITFSRWCGTAQFMALERGIREYVSSNDMNLTTVDAMEDNNVYLDLLNHPPHDVKGMIIFPWDTPEYREAVSKAINNGIKVVFVDRVISGLGVSSVSIDHFACAYEATVHLIEINNQPVYFFGHTERPSSSHQRFQGYLEAMHEAGYNVGENSKYIVQFPRSEAEIASTFRQNDFVFLLRDFAFDFFKTHKDDRYSIIGVNDDAASGVCAAAEKIGLKVGQNVCVAGIGNKPYCEKLPVPLTSVAQFDEKIGYEAAKLLHNEITGKQKRPINLVFPPELYIRQSSEGPDKK
jgi:DNA-binding LacI/PurR family transcriptional regulator/DNA-binding transcriptional regulator YhcF (GntR family)